MFTRAFGSIFLTLCLSLLVQAGDVRIPCDTTGGLIWISVSVADRHEPLHFLLDSGAGATVLDLDCARKLDLPLTRPEKVLGVHTEAVAHRVQNFVAKVGGIAVPSSVLALDLSDLRAPAGRRVDGLLGLDFLRQHVVQIDYARKELRLLRQADFSHDGEILSLLPRNDALCVSLRVNDRPGLFRVDTGCSTALQYVTPSSISRRSVRSSIALAADRPEYTVATVQLGTASFAGVEAGIHSTRIFPGEDGLLGNGLLSKFVVTIDAARNTLHLRKR